VAFAAGAKGWCTAASNLIRALNLTLHYAMLANDLDAACALLHGLLVQLK